MDWLYSVFTGGGFWKRKGQGDGDGDGGRRELTGSLASAQQEDQVQEEEDRQEEQKEVVDQRPQEAASLEFEEELLDGSNVKVDAVETNTGPVETNTDPVETNTDPVVVVDQDIMPVPVASPRKHNSLGNPMAEESNETNLTNDDIHDTPPPQQQEKCLDQTQGNAIQLKQQDQSDISEIESTQFDLVKELQEQEEVVSSIIIVPEFEEQKIQTLSATNDVSPVVEPAQNQFNFNLANLQRPQPHIPDLQTVSAYFARTYPRQFEQQQEAQQSKRRPRHEKHVSERAELHEIEVDNDNDDSDSHVEDCDDEEDDEHTVDKSKPVPIEVPWKCGYSYCRKTYKRKADFLQHQKTHKETQAEQQHQPGPSRPPPRLQQILKCDICQEYSLTKESLIAHMKTHEKREVVQDVVRNMKLMQLPLLKRAQTGQVVQSLPPPPPKISSTNRRSGSSPSPKRIKYHPAILCRFKCEFCSERFSVKSELKEHEEQIHLEESTLRCIDCNNKPFLHENEFVKHIKSHLNRDSVWKCVVCSSVFEEYKAYQDHLKSHLVPVYNKDGPATATPGAKLVEYVEIQAADVQKGDLELELFEIVGGRRTNNKVPSPKKVGGDARPTSTSTTATGSLIPTSAIHFSLPMTTLAIDSNMQENVTKTTKEEDKSVANSLVPATPAWIPAVNASLPMAMAIVKMATGPENLQVEVVKVPEPTREEVISTSMDLTSTQNPSDVTSRSPSPPISISTLSTPKRRRVIFEDGVVDDIIVASEPETPYRPLPKAIRRRRRGRRRSY